MAISPAGITKIAAPLDNPSRAIHAEKAALIASNDVLANRIYIITIARFFIVSELSDE
ncbi:MAG: hypothetical protein M9937_03805 [Chelatococcus sp.]|nr:hypothetical protein [Chelatococcus sp.]CAH1648769.1 hypothetical protein CHELA20_10278 [Hyphomicrobiales bacterium]CAH1691389.1 hypothetical protein CHELA41_50505 [Hyphomicrobiales bacterium]